MKTLTLAFNNDEDVRIFRQFMQKAHETEGTVPPLYCGLISSVLKRSKIVSTPKQEQKEKAKIELGRGIAKEWFS